MSATDIGVDELYTVSRNYSILADIADIFSGEIDDNIVEIDSIS